VESVIVQYERPEDGRHDVLWLVPGETATFGRGAPDHPVRLEVRHPGVGRIAGQITAAEDYWLLSNFSRDRTYVVENPEGAGEHVKVAPRRIGAPVPFELAKVVLPVDDGTVDLIVFAPQHRYVDKGELEPTGGETTTAAFSLDESAKYFHVLVALCEPRLRDSASVVVPTDNEIVERLRPLPACAGLTRSAVNFHLDYLARMKLRLREPASADNERIEARRATLVALALRFDLVRDEHLALLPPRQVPESA